MSAILSGMLIHFRMIVRTVAETATFVLDADLPAISAVGDVLHLHDDYSPYIVKEVTHQSGVITCVVEPWDDPGFVPLAMENVAGDFEDMARAGWRREG